MERNQLREEEQAQEEQEKQQASGMPTDEEERRESGMPGGGAGRRDEVGHSGVYPASSAEGAAGDAPLVGEEEWGQGERGAAGYEDSGDSELNLEIERQLGLLKEDRED